MAFAVARRNSRNLTGSRLAGRESKIAQIFLIAFKAIGQLLETTARLQSKLESWLIRRESELFREIPLEVMETVKGHHLFAIVASG